MSFVVPSCERKPCKRQRSARPPDVYPQEPRQKEDELTAERLKLGYQFNFSTSSATEYELAGLKDVHIDDQSRNKIISALSSIVSKKTVESNVIADVSRKKYSFKDVFWHARGSSRAPELMKKWFSSLAKNTPLIELARRVPVLHPSLKDGGPEAFIKLCEGNVAMPRAVWFLKMTAFYYNNNVNTDNRPRPRTKNVVNDPSVEWTELLIANLRETILKLTDYYSQIKQPDTQVDDCQKRWIYCTRLAVYMLNEGLLEKQHYFNWLVDTLNKINKNTDDGLLTIFLPFLMQNLSAIFHSEVHCRRLAQCCALKLAEMYRISSTTTDHKTCSQINTGGAPVVGRDDVYSECFRDFLSCPFHRSILLLNTTIIQSILFECPSALVWNSLSGESKPTHPSGLCGSALDMLPFAPSVLPISSTRFKGELVRELVKSEQDVAARSLAVESNWAHDIWSAVHTSRQAIVRLMLRSLGALDSASSKLFLPFSETEPSGCFKLDSIFEVLYSHVFNVPDSELPEIGESNATEWSNSLVIRLLCQWVVTSHRCGPQRALIVVRLLELRENKLEMENVKMEKYPFQRALLEYLITEAPICNGELNTLSAQHKSEFQQLVLLFGELIAADLFSHSDYVCTLIARGYLADSNTLDGGLHGLIQHQIAEHPDWSNVVAPPSNLPSIPPNSVPPTPNVDNPFYHAPNSVSSSIGEPHSVEPPPGHSSMIDQQYKTSPLKASTKPHLTPQQQPQSSDPPPPPYFRHYNYLLHFPIDSDEEYQNDLNQRQTILYGVGVTRDTQQKEMKKIQKMLQKLWSRKYSMEFGEKHQLKAKRCRTDLFAKGVADFKATSLFEQSVIVEAVADACTTSLNDFVKEQVSHLPFIDHIDLVLSLMENAVAFRIMINFIEQLFELLPKLEKMLQKKSSDMANNYVHNLAICLVGFLRRYEQYFCLCQDELKVIFVNLCVLLKHLLSEMRQLDQQQRIKPQSGSKSNANLVMCRSAEKALLCYIVDLAIFCPNLNEQILSQELIERIQTWSSNNNDASKLNQRYSKDVMNANIEFPTKPIGEKIVHDLRNSIDFRYSFVVNVFNEIANNPSVGEKMSDLGLLCCDLTTLVPTLGSDWLGALQALCLRFPGDQTKTREVGFDDIVDLVYQTPSKAISVITTPSTVGHLSQFFISLVGRGAVSLEKFLFVIVSSVTVEFKKPKSSSMSHSTSSGIGMEAEVIDGQLAAVHNIDADSVGIRLALIMIHSLLCAPHSLALGFSNTGLGRLNYLSKMHSELYLLTAAHRSLEAKPLMQLMKLLILLADRRESDGSTSANVSASTSFDTMPSDSKSSMEQSQHSKYIELPVPQLAFEVLIDICRVDWVRLKLFSSDLLNKEQLLEKPLTNPQAARLLSFLSGRYDWVSSHWLCTNEGPWYYATPTTSCSTSIAARREQVSILSILRHISLWNYHMSVMQLQLHLSPTATSAGVESNGRVLESLSRACLDIFNQQYSGYGSGRRSAVGNFTSAGFAAPSTPATKIEVLASSVWLLGPLVEELPHSVQGKLLKDAAHWLDGSTSEKRTKSMALLCQQPFLKLLMSCMKNQSEHRDTMLKSIQNQLVSYIAMGKEDVTSLYDRATVLDITETLRLRLTLVGCMFDLVIKNVEDWSMLLTQLVTCGVLTVADDRRIEHRCLDMLGVLLHTLLLPTLNSDKPINDETKKPYNNLVRKIRRELTDRRNGLTSDARLRRNKQEFHQLLPLTRIDIEVLLFDQYGIQQQSVSTASSGRTQQKGASATAQPQLQLDLNNASSYAGFQVKGKERISPWELIEWKPSTGSTATSQQALNWPMFGAVRVETPPESTSTRLARLLTHAHWVNCDINPMPNELKVTDQPIEDGKQRVGRTNDWLLPLQHVQFEDEKPSVSNLAPNEMDLSAGLQHHGYHDQTNMLNSGVVSVNPNVMGTMNGRMNMAQPQVMQPHSVPQMAQQQQHVMQMDQQQPPAAKMAAMMHPGGSRMQFVNQMGQIPPTQRKMPARPNSIQGGMTAIPQQQQTMYSQMQPGMPPGRQMSNPGLQTTLQQQQQQQMQGQQGQGQQFIQQQPNPSMMDPMATGAGSSQWVGQQMGPAPGMQRQASFQGTIPPQAQYMQQQQQVNMAMNRVAQQQGALPQQSNSQTKDAIKQMVINRQQSGSNASMLYQQQQQQHQQQQQRSSQDVQMQQQRIAQQRAMQMQQVVPTANMQGSFASAPSNARMTLNQREMMMTHHQQQQRFPIQQHPASASQQYIQQPPMAGNPSMNRMPAQQMGMMKRQNSAQQQQPYY